MLNNKRRGGGAPQLREGEEQDDHERAMTYPIHAEKSKQPSQSNHGRSAGQKLEFFAEIEQGSLSTVAAHAATREGFRDQR